MAFKFKTKKRPNALQSAIAGFAGGFGAGVQKGSQQALTQMLNEREEKKNTANKELNIFNSLVSGLPSTPKNRSDFLNARLSIMKGDLTASEAVDILNIDGLDYQTISEEKAEIKSVSENLDPLIARQEASAMTQAGMTGRHPTDLEVEQRTDESKKSLGITTPKTRKSYVDASGVRRYIDTGEKVFTGDEPEKSKPEFTKKDKMELLKDKIDDLKARLDSKTPPLPESMHTKVQAEYDKSVQQYNAMVNEALGFEDDGNPLGI